MNPRSLTLTLILPFSSIGQLTAEEAKRVDFNDHVQPILSEYCYHCHGPDSATRAPKTEPLRLDREQDAFTRRENTGKSVIIKGDPEASELIRRLVTDDEDDLMPPPESHKTIKPEEIEVLKQWIAQGAEYENHWAFIPPTKSKLPEAGQGWAKNAIDHFVAARLNEAGLQPNSEESPARFYRRLHFDLTGLPPSASHAAAFTWDKLESEIDRLLATDACAEHFTRQWLDLARYADTHGIHIDNYRAIWPYRDWVINAFKQNMPWDQFTIEQQAGDLLDNPTLDQRIATGFNRCLPTTGEGGAIEAEYNAIYAQDRVDTTSAVWLGLTAGCASCHDHKFDPISTKDFYAFTAFYRNTPMSALDGNNAEHPPNVFVPLMADRARWAELEQTIPSKKAEMQARRDTAQADFETWLASAKVEAATEIDSTLHLHFPLTEANGPLKGLVDGQLREWPIELTRIDGPIGKAVKINGTQVELGDLASFSRSDQVSYGGFIKVEGQPTGAVIARMDPSESYRGWDLYLEKGKLIAHVIETWNTAASKIIANKPLQPGKWHHVMVVYDGTKSGQECLSLFINGQPADSKINPNTVGDRIEINVPLSLGSRHKSHSAIEGEVALQDFRFYRRLLTKDEIARLANNALLEEVLAIAPHQRTDEHKQRLYDYYIYSIDESYRKLVSELDGLQHEKNELRQRGSVSLVMEEKDEEPFAHILNRGQYTEPGERVTPATPEALPPLPEGAPANRLGLAQWLVSRDNPLPARVTMNRLWQYFFSNGIVETSGDFGIMGARPSHPQLLDWLAVEFMDSGWNYRHMVKLIATSATYRQSGNITAEKLELDPNNTLISRGPRPRLDAEQLRDMALATGGLLHYQLGGPSVKPYQPVGIWEAVAMRESNTRHYVPDKGEKLYRRSLYTFWKRTAPHPAMEILNAPSREVSCTRRDKTNTPLQAFVTLNDPQFVEASRKLAEQALGKDGFDARLDFMTMALLARTLTAEERAIVKETHDLALATYTKDPEAAKALISVGESPATEQWPAPELATWAIISNQIFNLDECLTK